MPEPLDAEPKGEGEPTPADSQPAPNDTNQSQSSTEDNQQADNKNDSENEGKDDLAKHPRWIEREGDWKERFNTQEERHTEDMAQLRKDLTPEKPKPQEGDPEVPSWFGGDTEAYKDYLKEQDARDERIRKQANEDRTSQTTEEQKAVDEATVYMGEQITEIEKDKTLNPDGKEIDKNRLLKFVLDENLRNEKGEWNYKLGYELMKARGQVPTTTKDLTERKNFASQSSSNNSSDPAKPTVTTSEELAKDKPW